MTPLDSNIPCTSDLQDLWLLSLYSAPFLLPSAQNGTSRSRLPTQSQLTGSVCQQQLHTLHRRAFLLSYWHREKLVFCPWTAKALFSEIYNIPLIVWTEGSSRRDWMPQNYCLSRLPHRKVKIIFRIICFSVYLIVESALIRNNLSSEALD